MRALHSLMVAAACSAALAIQAAPAQESSSDSEAVGVVVVGGEQGTGQSSQLTKQEQEALATIGAKPPSAEHPVYHLRPEPFSENEAMLVTLDDLLGLALANNLGLRETGNNVERSHYTVDQTYYVYDPQFSASLNYSKDRGGATSGFRNSLSGQFSLDKPLEYGDAFKFSYSTGRTTGGGIAAESINSAYSFGYTRPLARGAGHFLNRIPRFIASNNLELSYSQLDDNVRKLKKSVLDTYYQAVAARQAIDVRQASIERALKQLERSVERYKAGLGIQADVLQSENSVLAQRTQLLNAEATYKSLLDQLTLLVGLPQEYAIKVDKEATALDTSADLPDNLWDLVAATDFNLKSLNTQMANLRLSREQELNRLKPNLSLSLAMGRGGSGTSFGKAVEGNDQNYSVGLQYSAVQGERTGKSQLAQTDLDLANLELSLKDAELTLKSSLRAAERDLQTRFEQIGLAQSNLDVASKTYDIMVERNAVGLATTLDVIIAQEDVLNAELSLLQARVSYVEAYRQIQLLAGLL